MNLEKSMLNALDTHLPVCMSSKYDTDEVQWNEMSPLDCIYLGHTIKIKFGRPASKQLAKDRAKCQTLRPEAKLSAEYDPKEYE